MDGVNQLLIGFRSELLARLSLRYGLPQAQPLSQG